MSFGKYYLAMVIIAFFFAVFIIKSTTSLTTTWLGTYTPTEHIALEYGVEYSKTYFKKSQCEKWIDEMKLGGNQGEYMCGKNCVLIDTELLGCEKMFEY